MSTELRAVEEQGRTCAARGGQSAENPFIGTNDSAKYLTWNRGFRAGRTPDPQCPNCRGTGRITLKAAAGASGAYDGAEVEDLCNRRHAVS